MSEANDSLLDLEKNRVVLEESIAKLEKAIQHWKTWDAEYEALKEEVDAVAESSQVNELHRIHRDFEGELLTGKELDEVFGQPERTKEQIVNLLDRRIDYVSKNVETLEKQLELAEEKHAEVSIAAQPNIAVDEEGQPITEIIEELDEDDNVISYELQKQGETLPQVQELLKKAGLQKQKQKQEKEQTQQVEKKEKEQVQEDPEPSTIQEGKKVAFADDTKAGHDDEAERSQAAKRVDKIMKSARQQTITDPIIPEEDDEDDALLRQQMLKYSTGEVGAVVAELDIEEDDEGYGDEDMDDYDFDEDEEMEDEDKWGRYTGRVVTDDYSERMLELEKKLGIKSGRPDTQKAAQSTNGDKEAEDEERVGRIVVKTEQPAASEPAKPSSNGKKGVRFADELDIAPEPSNPEPIKETQKDIVEPLSDVVERSAPVKAPTMPEKPVRQSRFKKAREVGVPKGPMDVPSSFFPEEEQRPVPTGPAGQTISDRLVEKDTVSKPTAPDEIDDSMLHFEVADEHQRMRRKFIQRDGGFLAEDESPIQPLDNDAAEPVSRFKAARLSRQ